MSAMRRYKGVLYGVIPMKPEVHFFALLVTFSGVYFGLILPVFHRISLRFRARKFVIRLGTPWSLKDKEHRWDVFLSFTSFIVSLGVSLVVLEFLFPLAEVGP
jgi:hypothetical protein